MKLTFKLNLLVILLSIFLPTVKLFAQDSIYHLQVSGISKAKKIKLVESDSFFKLKQHNGKKLKSKFSVVGEDFIVSKTNDTIYFSEIKWIKLKMQLNGIEKAASITGVFAGTFLSFGTVPMALYFIAVEGVFWPVTAAAATLSAAIIGFRALAGRRYNTKTWKLEANYILNPGH